ncbi:MAG TPA: sulfotransferase [Gammaproteobacteria bacterium]|jgi:hypothetical protein|nr:sulfotransferase [Gammaproteobacteria bacterium]
MNVVFVIGAARSGTKFLRDVIGASPYAAVVPYDVNYVWRGGNEGFPDDALPAAASAQVRQRIAAELCRQAKYGAGKSLLIEKTVSNCLRIPFLEQVFPEAKYIHLLRDGRDVVESAYRMWREKPDWTYLLRKARTFPLADYRYAAWYLANVASRVFRRRSGVRIWGPRYPGIDADLAARPLIEVCARQWAVCVESARRDLVALPPERVLTVGYEMLVRDLDVVGRIASFAGIHDAAPVLATYRNTVRRDIRSGWELLPESERRAVLEIISPQLSALGYPNPRDSISGLQRPA